MNVCYGGQTIDNYFVMSSETLNLGVDFRAVNTVTDPTYDERSWAPSRIKSWTSMLPARLEQLAYDSMKCRNVFGAGIPQGEVT